MKLKIKQVLFLFLGFLLSIAKVHAKDPNFHLYLCIGQSNMEGAARAEAQDSTVNPRFQVMAAVDCENLGRQKGNWYPGVPPLCGCLPER